MLAFTIGLIVGYFIGVAHCDPNRLPPMPRGTEPPPIY